MQITKLQKNQINDLIKLHKSCITETNSKFYPKHVIKEWLRQISSENVIDQLNDSIWIVAEKDKKMIGFAQYSIDDGYLYQINVHPDFQGRLIGKKLYEYIEKAFIREDAKEIRLNSTLNAVVFYKNLGFKKVKKIGFQLDKEELEMIEMVKTL